MPIAQETLEAHSCLVLGSKVPSAFKRLGPLLGHEQALQLQALLDAKGGQLIAGLAHIERAGGIAGPGERLIQQLPVETKAFRDLALEESGPLQAEIGLVPTCQSILKRVVSREIGGGLLREELGIGGFGFLEFEGKPFALCQAGLDSRQCTLQIGG